MCFTNTHQICSTILAPFPSLVYTMDLIWTSKCRGARPFGQSKNCRSLMCPRLKRRSSGVRWMCRVSFTLCQPCQSLWSPAKGLGGTPSVTADFLSSPFLHASWCSLILCSSLLVVSPMYTFPQLQEIKGGKHEFFCSIIRVFST